MYTGKLVRLRAYESKDIEMAKTYVNDPEIKRFLTPGVPYPLTLNDEKKFIDGISSSKNDYSFAVDTLDGHYIGGCGINNVDWKNRVCEVGIFIGDKDFLSKGYGSDAMKVLVDFIFNEMNLNRIMLIVYSFNERAIKSYEKCSFIKEGVMRQAMYKSGQYHDEIIMSILKDEYKK